MTLPIEVGIDITSLLKNLGPDKDGKGKLFLRLGRADGSDAVGELHECAVRTYDSKGRLLGESRLGIEKWQLWQIAPGDGDGHQ